MIALCLFIIAMETALFSSMIYPLNMVISPIRYDKWPEGKIPLPSLKCSKC